MKKLILISLFVVCSYAQMRFSNPKPSFDSPRKWLIKLNTDDIHIVNHTLGTIHNVLKQYPAESLKVVVITYSKGMRVLRKDYDKKTLLRIYSLQQYDVEFVACKNTIETMKWKKDDFIDDLTYVQAGIAEIIERDVAGWINVTPY